MVVGGPALVEYIRPSDEELRKRYNPDLQKRSAEQGDRRAQEFDDYVTKLKEWSKSDKSSMWYPLFRGSVSTEFYRSSGELWLTIGFLVWYAAQEELDRKQAAIEAQRTQAKEQTRTQREEMRKEMLGDK